MTHGEERQFAFDLQFAAEAQPLGSVLYGVDGNLVCLDVHYIDIDGAAHEEPWLVPIPHRNDEEAP